MKPNRSILHVEDDADDVYFMSRALQRSGIDLPVDVVNDGQSAIDFIEGAAWRLRDPRAACPCLMLLDINLPRRSGLEVLKWVRQESRVKNIIVLVLTSSTSEADTEEAYSLGANAYVIKPSDATRLLELGMLLKEFWLGWNQLPRIAP